MSDERNSSTGRMSRFRQYRHNAALEEAREKAIAPDMDALRWQGMKIVFVELPIEAARIFLFTAGLLLSVFIFFLFLPFLALSPKASVGAAWFFRELRGRIADEEERQQRLLRRMGDLDRLWKQRKKEIQNAQ